MVNNLFYAPHWIVHFYLYNDLNGLFWIVYIYKRVTIHIDGRWRSICWIIVLFCDEWQGLLRNSKEWTQDMLKWCETNKLRNSSYFK